MPEPTIIQGPAIVIFNSQSIYTQDDIVVRQARETFKVKSSHAGDFDERHKSSKVSITLTPVGQTPTGDDYTKFYPHDHDSVGTSIYNGTLVIHSITEGKTHTFHRAGISAMPPLTLSPIATLFGSMTFTAIGAAATAVTDAAFLKTIATAAFSDTTFDETAIPTDVYSAALGARATPYDDIGAMAGFLIRFALQVTDIPAADKGIADTVIQSIMCECEFAPSNLDDSEVDALLQMQGASAVLPGQSIAKANEDLVITGDNITFTLHKVGARENTTGHKIGEHRHRALVFGQKRAWSSGVAQPLWTFA